jgi:GT2 family glycosyltransferase
MPGDNNFILSVIIVNWNSKSTTIECLNSILKDRLFINSSGKAEIILIDNNSSDGSQEKISELFPQIRLIANKKNSGYAKACNQGLKIANGKFILLLGNDTILKNDALFKTVEFIENRPDCGAAGCRLFYPDGRLQGNCKKFPKLINAFNTYLSLNKLNYDYNMLWFGYDKTIEVDQIATTFLMIRKEVLDKTGGFDEQYRILYNDVDLCKRIWDAGYKILFNHTVEVIHIGSHSTNKAGFRVRKIMYGDIIRYYRNNFGIKAIFLLPVLTARLMIISIFKK